MTPGTPLIVTVHSWGGGVGKTTTVASLGYLMARAGLRVGLVDAGLQAPGLHLACGVPDGLLRQGVAGYLVGECGIGDILHDLGPSTGLPGGPGALFLAPGVVDMGAIARPALAGQYDTGLLHEGVRRMAGLLGLDVVVIDTHPGVNHEAVHALALADVCLVAARPDLRGMSGGPLLADMSRRLSVPRPLVLFTMVPPGTEHAALDDIARRRYECPMAGALPWAPELAAGRAAGPFAAAFPAHPLTAALDDVARLLAQPRT
ncbi:MinD/ParA family protein [Microbispora corallina]|uniref:CDP-3, 6-dideoxy-D-glycero-L-glycero-4-hexulose-4-reductase n=1 Tax=Microbispora corallina TaxID=83302 RepID=A0ABQ4G2P3_9ACTN|nr:ParA family protein [Microbispora corallina]GIH41329.1 CDP-3, 6-dideoxy-D-glycero-L-glycero-4-hexulose-4-reductase [Microbispora corallina]